MPFAINEATEYINPTKALEYMATERPIVSTPVEDVVLQFTGVVKISQTSDEFVRLCGEAATRAGPGGDQARQNAFGAQLVGVNRRSDGRSHLLTCSRKRLPVAASGAA